MVTMIAVGVCGLGLMDSILVNAVSAGEWVLWGWVGLNGYNDYSGCVWPWTDGQHPGQCGVCW